MEKEKHYVYILSYTERNDVVKIGRTTINPQKRAKQISSDTGVIGKFTVEFQIEVPDSVAGEAIVHYKFKEFRTEKEFFKIELEDAILKVAIELIDYFELSDPKIHLRENEFCNQKEEKIIAGIKGLETLLKYSDESLKREGHLKTIKKLKEELHAIDFLKKASKY